MIPPRLFALILGLTCMVVCEVRAAPPAGVGLLLDADGQHITVKAIIPNSPAASQKTIRVGDRITGVAQGTEAPVTVQRAKVADVVPLIRGAAGTTVRLTVIPADGDESQARVVSLVRGQVEELNRWGDGALLAAGEDAPEIELIRLPDGGKESLSSHRGKVVVLEFWSTWCGPCQRKMAELQALAGKLAEWKEKVVLIAASVDDSSEAPSKHLEQKGWTRTHNVWAKTDALRAYHVDGIPAEYVIDRQGKIVAANPANLAEIVRQQVLEESRAKAP